MTEHIELDGMIEGLELAKEIIQATVSLMDHLVIAKPALDMLAKADDLNAYPLSEKEIEAIKCIVLITDLYERSE